MRNGPTPPVRGGRSGRRAELFLLVIAAVVVWSGLVIVGFQLGRGVSVDLAWYGGGFLLVMGGAHLVVRRFAPDADPVLLPVAAVLNGVGLVMIYRLDLAAADKAAAAGDSGPAGQASAQLLWTAVGVVLFGVVLVVVRDHTVLANYSYTLLLLGLLFLAVPAVLPAQYSEVNGAQIWIKVPHLFSIQPGEFAKIALVVFAASFLASKRAVLNSAGRQVFGMLLPRGRDLGPLLLALLLCLTVFVRARDLGQALLLFGVILVMIYLATSRVSWMIIGLIGFCGGAYLAYLMFAHVRVRVDIWLDPFADPQNTGYQLVQSLLGLGTGGITGTGLGAGHPDIVPFASTDFITAAVGEELGLVGATAVILCYLLLAGGLAFTLVFQMFIVVGGVTRLIPLTGLTTPFLSYGGSSLLANYIILALLIRISDSARRPPPPPRALTATPQPLSDVHTELVPRTPTP